jgi:superfamily II DNA helicase RecQ
MKLQLTAIKSIIDNKDTFIVLPTGYGKSKIHVHFPEIYERGVISGARNFVH